MKRIALTILVCLVTVTQAQAEFTAEVHKGIGNSIFLSINSTVKLDAAKLRNLRTGDIVIARLSPPLQNGNSFTYSGFAQANNWLTGDIIQVSVAPTSQLFNTKLK